MIRVDIEEVAALMRRIAAEEAMPRWRNLKATDIVEKAGPDDLVTVADRAVEQALALELQKLAPGSEIVGEEGVHADPKRLELFKGGAPVWVIDPIDGTSAFAKGDPEFAVMLALVEKGELSAGWILAPVTGDLVCARKGGGVWHSSGGAFRRLSPPPRDLALAEMRGITGRRLMTAERLQRINDAASQFKSIEPAICAGIEYPKIASGEAHFAYYFKSEPWDHLPGLALATEHGFHFAKHDGSPYTAGDSAGGLLVAPSREAWAKIHSLLIG